MSQTGSQSSQNSNGLPNQLPVQVGRPGQQAQGQPGQAPAQGQQALGQPAQVQAQPAPTQAQQSPGGQQPGQDPGQAGQAPPKPPPRPPVETTWQCEHSLEVDGLPKQGKVEKVAGLDQVPLEAMTVGRKFILRCQGEPVFFDRSKIKLDMLESAKHNLHLLDVRRLDEKSGDFLMTSYKAGQFKVVGAQITDGKVRLGISEFPMQVETVLEPPKDGKPPQPYGPFGPVEMSWPLYYWASLIGFLIIVLSLIGRVVYKKLQWRRLMESLNDYKTAMQPYNQFNKDIRMIHREFETPFEGEVAGSTPDHLKAVEQAFRLYLVRELQLPALTWEDKALLKVMKKRHVQVYNQCGQFLRVTFRELKKAHNAGNNLKPIDCQQLAKLCQQTISRVYKSKRSEDSHT